MCCGSHGKSHRWQPATVARLEALFRGPPEPVKESAEEPMKNR